MNGSQPSVTLNSRMNRMPEKKVGSEKPTKVNVLTT